MTPFTRLLRNLWDRWRGVFYEGPEPPDRLRMVVEEFARQHPHATRRDWIEFTIGMVNEAYRSGHTRGVEWSDRDLDRRDPVADPELLMEAEGHDWSWSDGGMTTIERLEEEVIDEDARDPREDEAENALAQDGVFRARDLDQRPHR